MPKRINRLKFARRTFLICIIFGPLLWSEWLSLEWSSLFWGVQETRTGSVKILLVADPQLIGYQNEPHMVGWISRWDSDRYMKRAFEKVLNSFDPDLIIFLGDLLDENVQMTQEELDLSYQRFLSVFQIADHVQAIFIAGDNDVGGENEPVYSHLIDRFKKYFPNRLKPNDKLLEFLEISELTIGSYQPKLIKNSSYNGIKLLLSHMPILRSISGSTTVLYGNYSPDLIISGHDHTAEIYIRPRNYSVVDRFGPVKKIYRLISPNESIVELQIPTASYRMGVPDMGYGALVLTPGHPTTAEYTVLWVPGRYPQLFLYLFCLVVGLCFYILYFCCFFTFKFLNYFGKKQIKSSIYCSVVICLSSF